LRKIRWLWHDAVRRGTPHQPRKLFGVDTFALHFFDARIAHLAFNERRLRSLTRLVTNHTFLLRQRQKSPSEQRLAGRGSGVH